MMSKNESQKGLWDFLAELKKAYSFDGDVFIDIPESAISAQEVVAIYESLDDHHKEAYANLYGLTVVEFRELLVKGWKDFREDDKYTSANDFERYFYQIADPIVEEIREAAKDLDYETKDDFIFGLLPTREINAVAIRDPNNSGYVIAINTGMMFFLQNIGQLYNRFHSKLMEQLKNPAKHIETDLVEKYIQELIPECIDDRTNHLFVDLVISYFLLQIPGFWFTRPSLQEILFGLDEGPGGINDNFSKLVLPFILCHEYAHFCEKSKDVNGFLTEYHESLTPEGRVDIADELQKRRNSMSELMADNIGFQMLIRVAQIHFEMPGSNSKLQIPALGRAYSGMNSFFSCIEVLEKAKSIINGKSYDENHDETDSHLPARIRRQWLEERWIDEITTLGYPTFQISLHGKIFERFTHTLWENNKDKIHAALLQGK